MMIVYDDADDATVESDGPEVQEVHCKDIPDTCAAAQHVSMLVIAIRGTARSYETVGNTKPHVFLVVVPVPIGMADVVIAWYGNSNSMVK